MYHDRTAWRCAFFVGKKYGSKGYPQRNAAHMDELYECCNIIRITFVINNILVSFKNSVSTVPEDDGSDAENM
jgi:hypothetical protein